MSIITANKLSSLFRDNQRLGQGLLPELIKRLVIASSNCNWIRFPNGDSIWAQSFDGIVKDIPENCVLVPAGNSVWELGTDLNPKPKADSDFLTRSSAKTKYKKKDYTFVFCTPHIWNGNILEWETEKKNQSAWKDVRLIDGSMIESWLNSNIEIAVWLLNSFGERVPVGGIATLEQELQRVHGLTKPNITNAMLICSNEDKAKELVASLESGREKFNVIKATTNIEQGYFFVLGALTVENNSYVNSKILVAKSKEGLQTINSHCKDKIVIINFVGTRDEDYSGQNNYIDVATERVQTPTLILNPIFFDDFSKALESMGFSLTEASQIASKVNRNISCLKRRYAENPMLKKPQWAEDSNKKDIIPIALLSEINAKRASDKEIILKLIDGSFESYIERLDLWLSSEDPPIFREGNVYRIYAKEEALQVLGLSHNSPKVSVLEELCKSEIFVTKNARFEKKPEEWHIIDSSFRYSGNLINGVLSSFAIMSNDEGAQRHFDDFIKAVLVPMKTDTVLLHSFVSYFPLMSEVSAKALIDFVNEALDNDDTLIKNLLPGYGFGIISQSSNFINLYWGIKPCLYRSDYAVAAQRVLLRLYLKDYQSPHKKQIDDEIIESFAPFLSCEYAISPTDKMNILLSASKVFNAQEKQLAEKIFYKMRWGQINHFMSSSKPRWKEHKKFDNTYNPHEFAQVSQTATEWLYENVVDRITLFSKVLDSGILSNATEEYITKTFEELDEKLIKKITDSETRRLLNIKTDELIKRYRRFAKKDKGLDVHIVEKLKKVFQDTLPKDLFEQHRNLFERESLSLYDRFDDDGTLNYQEMTDRAIETIGSVMRNLIAERGESILDKLIEITNDNNYFAWDILFKFSKDKISDMRKQLGLGKNAAFIRFVQLAGKLCNDVQNLILNIQDAEQRINILQNLPPTDDAIEFAERNNLDEIFWNGRRRYFDITEKMYTKMLKFCPINLLMYVIRYDGGIDYDKALEVLKAIISFHTVAKSDAIETAWRSDASQHYLVDLIDKLDKKYYTDELVNCEFQLLNIYMSGQIRDMYPRGVQEFFWRNPDEYFKLFKELLFGNNAKDMPHNSLAMRMVAQAIQPFGRTCIIPAEYILSKSGEFKRWHESLLDSAKKEEKKVLHRFCMLLVNIIGMCPDVDGQTIWPSQNVADMLDSFAEHWSAEDMQEINDFYKRDTPIEHQRTITKEEYVANSFAIAKTNTRGVRTVTDGSHELGMAERYLSYAEQYKISNPVTYTALKTIARHYQSEGENDRKRAILGNYSSD